MKEAWHHFLPQKSTKATQFSTTQHIARWRRGEALSKVADGGIPLEGGGQGKPSRRWRTGEALSKVADMGSPLEGGGQGKPSRRWRTGEAPLEGGGEGKPSRRWRTGEALSKVADRGSPSRRWWISQVIIQKA